MSRFHRRILFRSHCCRHCCKGTANQKIRHQKVYPHHNIQIKKDLRTTVHKVPSLPPLFSLRRPPPPLSSSPPPPSPLSFLPPIPAQKNQNSANNAINKCHNDLFSMYIYIYRCRHGFRCSCIHVFTRVCTNSYVIPPSRPRRLRHGIIAKRPATHTQTDTHTHTHAHTLH